MQFTYLLLLYKICKNIFGELFLPSRDLLANYKSIKLTKLLFICYFFI